MEPYCSSLGILVNAQDLKAGIRGGAWLEDIACDEVLVSVGAGHDVRPLRVHATTGGGIQKSMHQDGRTRDACVPARLGSELDEIGTGPRLSRIEWELRGEPAREIARMQRS